MSKQESSPIQVKTYNVLFIMLIVGLLTYSGVSGIENGPTKLEHNFPYRKQMVSFVTEFRLSLGDRVFPQVIANNNDTWLEFTGERNLDDYQNAVSLSPGKLEKLQKSLQKFHNKLKAKDITLLIIIAPNKATIYPEMIPAEIQKVRQNSQMDTLLAYIAQHGPNVFVDLRPTLLDAKKGQQIYYSTDTHWNAIGAFYAYKDIIDALSETHPELQAKELTDFSLFYDVPSIRDISKLISATSLLESAPHLRPKFDVNTKWTTLNTEINPASIASQPDISLPRAVIYHDSFGEGLKPYLSLHFSKSIFITRNSQQKDFFSYNFIDQFNPDVVVIEIVERDLQSLQLLLGNFSQSK